MLICGILSPLAAIFLYVLVYGTLTRYSADLEKDWLFRLSVSTLAMTVPFFVPWLSRSRTMAGMRFRWPEKWVWSSLFSRWALPGNQ